MIIVGVVVIIVGISIISIFNQLIRFRNFTQEAWSDIAVQLKMRRDLISSIVETVQSYTKHERQVLEKITKIRVRLTDDMSVNERAEIEGRLSKALTDVLVIVENYPDLKASKNFLKLQKALVDVEDKIQIARRYYNKTVRNYNNLVESFPTNLVASLFGFKKREFFEIEYATERNIPA